jgi:gliding motility-associated-like protein
MQESKYTIGFFSINGAIKISPPIHYPILITPHSPLPTPYIYTHGLLLYDHRCLLSESFFVYCKSLHTFHIMRKQLLAIIAIIGSLSVSSQDFSNKGKDFWVGYGYHQVMTAGNAQDMVLYFAADLPTNVNVSIPGLGYSQNYAVAANSVATSLPLPKAAGGQDARLLSPSTGPENKGIHITADRPIVAYAHIYNASVSGASILFPTNTLGKEYYSINYKNISNTNNANCWFYVIAADTGTTTVEITPSAAAIGHPAGVTFTVNLTQGQVYNVMGQLTSAANPFTGEDLTGSTIRSIASGTGGCKKIAVFSGSGRISLTCTAGVTSSSSDNYMVQAFPKTAWGKKFLTTTANAPNSRNIYRVCVSDPTTVVRINGAITTLPLLGNFYYEIPIDNASNLIEADKPITVAQYFTSQGACANGANTDPEVIYLSPVEQNINKVIWNATPNFGIQNHHFNVVIPNTGSAITSFRLRDATGATLPIGTFTPHPQEPNFSFIKQQLPGAGIYSIESDSGFNAIAYGFGAAESYGYNAGTNIKDLYRFAGTLNTNAIEFGDYATAGSPFFFTITYPYQPTSLNWDFNGSQTPNVFIANPATILDSTYFVGTQQVWRYKLPNPYIYNTPGDYPITVTATTTNPDGCGNTQEYDYILQVLPPPVTNFVWVSNGCVTDSVAFVDSTRTIKPAYKWFWDFGDPASGVNNTSALRNPKHLFSAPGTYNVKLYIINTIGAISVELTKSITVTLKPVAKFGMSSPICAGKPITFSDTSMAFAPGSLAKWHWDFGDGFTTVRNNGSDTIHTYNPWNANRVARLMVETNSGCQSDTFSRAFKVHPNPVANFNLPGNVCLPDGNVLFTSTSTLADGNIATASYQWDFGDPASGPANTAATASANHLYTSTGPFNIKLQVTSLAGCVHDTTKALSTVYTQADGQFTPPAPVCLGTPLSFASSSTAPAGSTITNYHWDFGAPPGTVSNVAGANTNNNYTAAGTYTVLHWITTDKGCKSDTATGTVTVHVVPSISGTASTGPTTCNGNDGTITLNGLLAGQTYTVNFAKNGTAQPTQTLTASAGGSIVINGLTAGTYTNINCTANNCTSPNAATVTLNDPPLPPAPLVTGSAVLCAGSNISLNASNVAGASAYTWIGPGGFSSNLQNPTIVGATTGASGPYTVTATVNNCVSPASVPFNVVVNVLPVIASASASNPTTCGGVNGSITLTGLQPGQTYTVDVVKNGVSQPALSITANASGNVVLTGLNSATYAGITCTANNCTSAAAPVQVLTDPAAPAAPAANSNGPVCAGATVTLSTPNLANATYTWAGPNGFASTNQNPSIPNVTTAASGNYSVTVTVNNCVSNATIIPVQVNALPTGNFSSSTPSCETKTIAFNDLSVPNSGNVSGWAWDFGDPASGANNTSNAQNPTHSFATAGSYTVSLTATTDRGCTGPVFSRPVTINPQPKAGFILPEVCLSDAFAQFVDTSRVIGGTINSWAWDFGDPASGALNTSTQQNAQHKYNAVGLYNVKLKVTTTSGCVDSLIQPITVNGDIPVANFTPLSTATMCANDSISIQDGSTVNFGSVTKVEIYWDNVGAPGVFETDDTPTPGKIYKHLYPNFQSPPTRSFTIRYRAYSGGTCVNDRIRTIVVNAAPAVQFNAMPPACSDAVPFQITQASETGGVVGAGVFSGPGVSPTGIFSPTVAGVGTHTIRYTYTATAGGCVDFKEQTIQVLTPPTAKFGSSAPACETQTVTFTDSSTVQPGTGTIATWTWNFGDGTPSVVRNNNTPVTHTYAAAGPYTVTLQVTTNNGCRSAVTSLPITVRPLPTVDFSVSKTCLPSANAQFTDLSTIADGTQNAFTYLWTFGDPATGLNDTSRAKNPSHIYTNLGPYTVTLRVTSGNGCVTTRSKVYDDIHAQPIADFAISDADGVCIGDAVSFTDNSNYQDGTPVSWFWSLGDGTIRNTQNIGNYTYATARTYPVKLLVVNSHGCPSDTTTKQFTVHPYPVVNAGPDRFVLEGGTITLEPIVTGNDLQFLWSPGIYLSSTTVEKPVFQAGEDRTYTLTVTARGGCSASDQMFVKVLKMPQVPNTFTPNNDGINDFWLIDYLNTYPSNRVQVFSRTGQLVFESKGYGKPWDGTMKGKPLPFDTYYYIIEPGNGRKPLTGYVTIVK